MLVLKLVLYLAAILALVTSLQQILKNMGIVVEHLVIEVFLFRWLYAKWTSESRSGEKICSKAFQKYRRASQGWSKGRPNLFEMLIKIRLSQ